MQTAHRTFVATGMVALLAAAGVTAAVAADPPPDGPPRIAFLANGRVPADALAAGPIAGQLGAPVYTTEQATLSPEAAAALDEDDPELVIVLGGPVAIADGVVDQVEAATGLTETDDPTPAGGVIRAAGENRFATATAVADLLAAYDPAFLPVASQAVDADTLDGKDATDFQPAGDYLAADGKADSAGHADTAADADTLDGQHASDFTAADSPLVPVAIVNVDHRGWIEAEHHRAPATGAPTVSHSLGSGRYDITIPGVPYGVFNDVATCNAIGTDGTVLSTDSSSGALVVYAVDTNGDPVDDDFTCAIHDLS